MKKYLLILITIIFSLICVFALNTTASSPFGAFEIYNPNCGSSVNCTPYPAVTNVSVPSSPVHIGGKLTEIITASATDVSGVRSMTAIIESGETELHSEKMDFVADNSYSVAIDVSGYSDGIYSVKIAAVDFFGNNSMNEGNQYVSNDWNFTIGVVPTTAELWADDTAYPQSGWGDASSNPEDPYNTLNNDSRAQFIVSANELHSAGLNPGGNISAIYLKTFQRPGQDLVNFRIRAKLTIADTTTQWEGEGWTTLWEQTNINVLTEPVDPDITTLGNWKKYPFTHDFQWDGTSNIMFDISRDDIVWGGGGGMYKRAVSPGGNRMFAGSCYVYDDCVYCNPNDPDSDCDTGCCFDDSGDKVTLPDRTNGGNNGTNFDFYPDLKIVFTNNE